MKYVKWNYMRAIAAICAVVILLSAVDLAASADSTEATQTEMQQNMPNEPQGRRNMPGGPRQGEPGMPFGMQNGDFAPPADGEQQTSASVGFFGRMWGRVRQLFSRNNAS